MPIFYLLLFKACPVVRRKKQGQGGDSNGM